jgi:hypothetical protein
MDKEIKKLIEEKKEGLKRDIADQKAMIKITMFFPLKNFIPATEERREYIISNRERLVRIFEKELVKLNKIKS